MPTWVIMRGYFIAQGPEERQAFANCNYPTPLPGHVTVQCTYCGRPLWIGAQQNAMRETLKQIGTTPPIVCLLCEDITLAGTTVIAIPVPSAFRAN